MTPNGSWSTDWPLSSAADEGAIETLRAMVAGDERLRVPVGSMEAGVAADEAALGTV